MSKKLSRALALIGVATLAVLPLVSCADAEDEGANTECTPAHEFETITQGELTVASYDLPPATIIKDDTLTGFEGDLLTEVAKRECLTLTISSAGGAGAVIPSVQTDRADVGSGNWLRTNERAEIVRLSQPLMLDVQAVASISGITSDELKGHRVGSISGNLWNDSLQKWLGDDFVMYQDDEALYGDLEAGRIDALVTAASSIVNRFESKPIEGAQVIPVTPNPNVPEFERPGQITWPSSLENEPLGEALDANLKAMKEDGTMTEILEKWGLDPKLADIDEVWNL